MVLQDLSLKMGRLFVGQLICTAIMRARLF